MQSQDFQKREAKQSLWDMDGQHVSKKHRNKGKGRGKDRRLAQEALAEWELEGDRCDGDCPMCRAVAD